MANIQLQLRRGTAIDWSTANSILADGEIGIEVDTRKFKIGDGVNAWNALQYGGLQGPAGSGGGAEVASRKLTFTFGATSHMTITALGSQSDLDSMVVSATATNLVEISSIPAGLTIQSISFSYPSNYNPNANFEIRYPVGTTVLNDISLPGMIIYNEAGVSQSTTGVTISMIGTSVSVNKSGLATNAGYKFKIII